MKLWRVQAFSVIGFFHSGSWIIVSHMNLAVVVVHTVWLCLWSSYRRLAVYMVVVQTVWLWSSYRPFGCVCGRRPDRLAVSVVVAQTVVTNLAVVVVQSVWLCLWSSYRPFGRVCGRRTDRLAVSVVVVQSVWLCLWSSPRPFGCVCGRRTNRCHKFDTSVSQMLKGLFTNCDLWLISSCS